MNAKRRWYELLLPGMAVLLVLASGTLRTAKAYDYIQDDWEPYTEDDDHTTPDSDTSWKVYGDAEASTFSRGTYACNCWSYAYSEANDDRADAYANSQASWLTSWTWQPKGSGFNSCNYFLTDS